jgi:protease-4
MKKPLPTEPSFSRRLLVGMLIIVGLLFVGSLFALILSGGETTGADTAIITIGGPIMAEGDGSLWGDGTTSATELVDELQRARDDDNIRSVILMINSPGGSAVASDEIAQAVKDVRAQNKTVVAVIREEGASGAYWIASSTDHIIANRMSVTGSIGVISSYLQFDEFLDDWNVTYNRLTAGDQKDLGDPFTHLTPQGREFLQAKLDRVHVFFIEEVARNRNMSVEKVTLLADGRFYLGVEALDVGLVDQLGGKPEALAYLEARTGSEPVTVDYAPEYGFFDQLLGLFGMSRTPSVMDYASYARTAQDASAAQGASRRTQVLQAARSDVPVMLVQ